MNSFSRKTLLVSALAVLVVVGGGCWYQFKQAETAIPTTTSTTQGNESDLEIADSEVVFKHPLSKDAPECTQKPIEAGTGRMMYPIAEAYRPGDLPFLGEAFTQAQCGEARLKELYPDGLYSWGSSLRLSGEPSPALQSALLETGFVCDVEPGSPCWAWELNTAVDIDKIIKLEPYVDEFGSEDCLLCG
jgi:hypothetical protein